MSLDFNKLLGTYENPEFEYYSLTKKALENGIVFSYHKNNMDFLKFFKFMNSLSKTSKEPTLKIKLFHQDVIQFKNKITNDFYEGTVKSKVFFPIKEIRHFFKESGDSIFKDDPFDFEFKLIKPSPLREIYEKEFSSLNLYDHIDFKQWLSISKNQVYNEDLDHIFSTYSQDFGLTNLLTIKLIYFHYLLADIHNYSRNDRNPRIIKSIINQAEKESKKIERTQKYLSHILNKKKSISHHLSQLFG